MSFIRSAVVPIYHFSKTRGLFLTSVYDSVFVLGICPQCISPCISPDISKSVIFYNTRRLIVDVDINEPQFKHIVKSFPHMESVYSLKDIYHSPYIKSILNSVNNLPRPDENGIVLLEESNGVFGRVEYVHRMMDTTR